MNDFRSQIDSLSPAEKAELLEAVWESLEADAQLLTEAQRAEIDARIARHGKILPMLFLGRKSGRACLRSHDPSGFLDAGGGRRPEAGTVVV